MSLAGADMQPGQEMIYGGGFSSPWIYLGSYEAFLKWLDVGPIVEWVGSGTYVWWQADLLLPWQTPSATLSADFSGLYGYCPTGLRSGHEYACAVVPVECRAARHHVTIGPQ